MPLSEAAKCALISMDSTIRSNLSVGLPLDLVIVRRDEHRISSHVDIDSTNEYFPSHRERWGEALREIFCDLPNPDWLIAQPPSPAGWRRPRTPIPHGCNRASSRNRGDPYRHR
jgi:putative proteasome-type protease